VIHDLAGGGRDLDVGECRPCSAPAWSPDGTSLLVASPAGVTLVPRLGGAGRRFNRRGHVAWNREGTAFASADLASKQIEIARLDGVASRAIPLEGNFTWIRGLDWSSVRNELVVLTADGNRLSSAWIVAPDGSRQERLFDDARPVRSIRWAPNGSAVYYLRGGDVTELVALRVSDAGVPLGEPVTLTSGVPMGPNFTVRADGRSLLYTRELRFANLWSASLAPADAPPHQITTGSFVDQFPSVSPDGTRVVFARQAGRTSNVFALPLAGGEAEQLSFVAATNGAPAWSPDGRSLAFCAALKERHVVWTLDLGTNQARSFDQTSCPASGAETPVVWGPGRDILYQRPGNRNYHRLDPATAGERALVADESVGWIFAPLPSPDTSVVAAFWNRIAESRKERADGIWLLSASGQAPKLLLPGFAWPVGWSPDASTIFAFLPRTAEIVSVARTGGEPRVLRDLSAQRVGLAPALTPDRRRVIYAVHAIHADVWALDNFDPAVR
jgi:Tol biopolymer transport system component